MRPELKGLVQGEVRRYYDNNTAVFERFGQGGKAIHRAVWAEGVTTRQAAFAHVDRLVAQEAARYGDTPRLLDLGCGLAASLMHLAAWLPQATSVGVTISPKQAQRARALVSGAGLAARVTCLEGDYLDLADGLGTFDLAFAIEAFVHSPDGSAFFGSVARRLRPGGRLIICDDFQARPAREPREERLLDRIRRGWAAHTLIGVQDAGALAGQHGFALVENRDLTGFLELRRPRDVLLSALLMVAQPFRPQSTLWRSWMGGDALQHALGGRLIEYRFTIFERSR